MVSEHERLLTPQEAAAVLGVSVRTIYKWSARRLLPVVKLGHSIRFRREALDYHVRRHEARAKS